MVVVVVAVVVAAVVAAVSLMVAAAVAGSWSRLGGKTSSQQTVGRGFRDMVDDVPVV